MKIIRADRDVVKVVLSAGDMEHMNIDVRQLTPESPELGGFLREVLDSVKAEIGFSAERILVEASPAEDGMVLTISSADYADERARMRAMRTSKRNSCAVFEFLSFEDLTEMLKNLPPITLIYMRLYSYRDRFYLAVPQRHIPILIYEYSFKKRKSSVAEYVLAEYGEFLAGGCRLMSLSAGLKKLN